MAEAFKIPVGGVEVSKIPATYKRRKYKVVELDNKMKAILIHEDECDSAKISVNVRVGHYNDKEYKIEGLGYIVHHLLKRKGTKKYPGLDSLKSFAAENGGEFSGGYAFNYSR